MNYFGSLSNALKHLQSFTWGLLSDIRDGWFTVAISTIFTFLFIYPTAVTEQLDQFLAQYGYVLAQVLFQGGKGLASRLLIYSKNYCHFRYLIFQLYSCRLLLHDGHFDYRAQFRVRSRTYLPAFWRV